MIRFGILIQPDGGYGYSPTVHSNVQNENGFDKSKPSCPRDVAQLGSHMVHERVSRGIFGTTRQDKLPEYMQNSHKRDLCKLEEEN